MVGRRARRKIRTSSRRSSECLHIAHAFERAAEFDVIHNSFDFLPLTYSGLVATPVLTTIHGFSSPRILPVYESTTTTSDYVAISDADRASEARLPRDDPPRDRHRRVRAATADPGDYLLFFGRIHPDKGTGEAIEIAAASGQPLVIAGIVQDQRLLRRGGRASRLDGDRDPFVGAVGAESSDPPCSAAPTRCFT